MKSRTLLFLIAFFLLGFSSSGSLDAVLKNAYLHEIDTDFEAASKVLESYKKSVHSSSPEVKVIDNYLAYYSYLNSGSKDIKMLDAALQKMQALSDRNAYESNLLVKLYAAKYLHTAYNGGTWNESLAIAMEGYSLKDFEQAMTETKTDYLYDLGYLYDKAGNSFEGIKFFKKSLDLYVKQFGEVNNEVALNYNNLAFAYTNVYNQRNTIAYYEKAAGIWEQVYEHAIDKKGYLITVYNNLTYQYIKYGDYEKAKWANDKLKYHFFKKFNTSEKSDSEQYLKHKLTYILNNVRIHLISNEPEKAEKLVEEILKDKNIPFSLKENLRYLIGSIQEIANYYYEQEKFTEVIAVCSRAIAIAQQYNNQDFLQDLNTQIALAYAAIQQPEKALHYIELAQGNTVATNFTFNKYNIPIVKAGILANNNKNSEAIILVNSSIEQLVFELTKNKKSIHAIQFSDVKDLVSSHFIGLFIKSGQLYFNEYKRTHDNKFLTTSFNLYSISAALFKDYYLKGEYNEELNNYQSDITEGLLNISALMSITLKDKISLLNTIERNASQHLLKEFLRKIHYSDNKNNQLVLEIKDLKDELAFYKNQQPANSKDVVQNKTKTAAIEKRISELMHKTSKTYQELEKTSVQNFDIQQVMQSIAKDEVIIKYYTLSNDVFGVFLRSDDIEIVKLGKTAQIKQQVEILLSSIKSIQEDYVASAAVLFENLALATSSEKLIVIPDGFLNYLPFELLYDNDKSAFLMQQQVLSYDYSLPIWLFNRSNSIKVENNKLIAFSPDYNYHSDNEKRVRLSDLKFAKKEAKEVAALFKGTCYSNKAATKQQFLNAIDEYGLFHFSMHSLLNESDFNQSCLVFANDEKLYFSELYGMDFPAKMAVLSACDAGNGTLKSGEGVMSISRALAYSGVQSSVYSLWQVPDRETAEIMVLFYEHLKKGQSKDEALSNAKRIFVKRNPLKQHPYYWAGFVVNGNMSPIVTENTWWMYILLTAILLLLFFILRKRKSIQFL
jgi:CHAT domain-containing protein